MDEAPVLKTTVLFVSRNAGENLRRSLASVEAAQDRASIEVIVVDNGSTDGSAQLDAEFVSASFLRLPKNFGHTKAFNIGIRTAKGEYVLLAEPGTEFAGDAIRQLAARLDTDSEAAAVCPALRRVFLLPNADQLLGEPSSLDVTEAQAPTTVEYPGPAPILVRRTFLVGMRYLDERFGDTGYDLDLARQIANAGKKIIMLPDVRAELPAIASDAGSMDRIDRVNAAAVYAAKHFGFGTSLKIRLKTALGALGRFDFSVLGGVLSGRKIDGEQPES